MGFRLQWAFSFLVMGYSKVEDTQKIWQIFCYAADKKWEAPTTATRPASLPPLSQDVYFSVSASLCPVLLGFED